MVAAYSALTHALFIMLCSLFFFFEFLLWQSSADRILTLNMNILLPMFGSTWSLLSIWNLGTHEFRYDFTIFFIYMNSDMNS